MLEMSTIKIDLPMILCSYGVFFVMFGPREKIRDALLEICQEEGIVPSFLSRAKVDEKEGILVLYEISESAVKDEIVEKVSKRGIEVRVVEAVKVNERYIPKEAITFSLLGEKVTIIPSKRLHSHEIATLKMFGRGIKPIAKKVGEEEGEEIASFELSELKTESMKEIETAIRGLIRVLECLGEIPKAEVTRNENNIEISFRPTAPGEITKNRLYGILKGFFMAKGVTVLEEIEKGELKLKIETPEGFVSVRVRRVE